MCFVVLFRFVDIQAAVLHPAALQDVQDLGIDFLVASSPLLTVVQKSIVLYFGGRFFCVPFKKLSCWTCLFAWYTEATKCTAPLESDFCGAGRRFSRPLSQVSRAADVVNRVVDR